MEAQGKERSLLRDLALIYITLAHGTDQNLSQVEVETISRRLRAWQTQVTEETVLSAIKDALEDYTEETARAEVQEAVLRVHSQVDSDMLQEIVEDLTEIALSDDKFLFEESAFIGELARTWDVHVDGGADDVTGWSVLLENGGGHAGWTPLHDLALIYLHLAHRTDQDLDESEIETIARNLNEWTPDVDRDRVLKIVQDAMHAYVQGPDKRVLEDSIGSLRGFVPTHQRAAILSDLQRIAGADGTVLPAEHDLIRKLAQTWAAEAE